MRVYEITERTPERLAELLAVWERSVRATHTFLSESEILRIRGYVPQALAAVPELAVLEEDGRLLGGLGLLALPAFSSGFWALYLFRGLTDMADGPVARRIGSASVFGARLDTAADAVFLAAAFAKLLPALTVPGWLWAWLALITAIKIGNLLWALRHGKGLVTAHTALNRLTGLVLFLLPLTLPWLDLRQSALPVCVLATAAALQEGKVLRGQSRT